MKKGGKKLYYGKRIKREIIEMYLTTSVSMDELSEFVWHLKKQYIDRFAKKNWKRIVQTVSKAKIMSINEACIMLGQPFMRAKKCAS